MNSRSLSITFVNGARQVTGSNFILEAKDGDRMTRVAIDCGLTQGERFCDASNAEPFPYDASAIDALFVTHAHADHIGLVPKFVKAGFRGAIYATPPTIALAPIMLEDTASLIVREAERCGEQPPYRSEDIGPAVALMKEVEYEKALTLAPGITATLYNAGHILGSATVMIEAWGTRILFTGDLGRTPAIIVPDRTVSPSPHYLVTESVYGDRTHSEASVSETALKDAVLKVVKDRGALLVPSFSLERTQIILKTLDRFVREGVIPSIPVFMDSPLAAKVTDVYVRFPEYLREDIRAQLESGDDPFSFPSLSVTDTTEASEAVDAAPSPKIIIAGAGMSHGGRIRRHEMRHLPEKTTTLLLVGYQVPGSLGRRLQAGADKVKIDEQWITVRATVRSTDGFSAHADRDDLLKFAEDVKPREVFVVLGEMSAATYLAQRISGFLGIKATIPLKGERYELEIKKAA